MRNQLFIPLPKPLVNILPKLLTEHLITKMAQRAVAKHLPKNFDHNCQCEYYFGEVEHDANNGWLLKRRTPELIDNGLFHL